MPSSHRANLSMRLLGRRHACAMIGALATFCVAPDARAEDKAPPTFRAGAASIDVTPPIGIPMWGYGSRRDKPSQGVMDKLEANVIVLEADDQRLALVGLDIGRAPTRKSMARIRERIKKDSNVGAVFIVGSHTHHGPCLEVDDVPSEDPYVPKLENKIVQAIGEAAKALKPARMGIATKEVPHNRNRHSRLPNKPVDRELAVLRFDDLEGKPIAVAVNFAAHPTMINDMTLQYSADYVGAMKRQVEKDLGCVCVFLQGSAGDMSVNADGLKHTAFGTKLGGEVVALAKSIKSTVPEKPSIVVRDEDFHFPKMRLDFNNALVRAAFVRAFFKKLVDHYAEEYKDGSRPHLTVAVINGQLGLVGASGEFFCDHSLQLKRRSRLPNTLFLGYCNDYHNYFPTIQAAAEGGYGADPTVSPVEIGAGELILNRALYHLYDIQGKFKKGLL